MKWDFKLKLNGVSPEKIHRTQFFIDSEILRYSDKYTPKKTGNLIKSGTFGTEKGSGIVKYNAPYAKRQYFAGKASGQRGRRWVKRMWLSQGKHIIKNANKILNGK